MKNSSRFKRFHRQQHNRQGAALVFAVVLMFTLFGFLAFSIDTGYLAQSKAEMRRTADSAAMAGCWELYHRLEAGEELEQSQLHVKLAAADIAKLNPVCQAAPNLNTALDSHDIRIGYLDNLRDGAISDDVTHPYFAVQVNVQRTQQQNGEIPFFFGQVFGTAGRPMQVAATAVMARHIGGFRTPPTNSGSLDLLPFALDLQTWNAVSAGGGNDEYAFDAATGKVVPGADGVRELNLYPQGTGSPGNRGTVDIGGSNNSTKDIARQIVHGISTNDLEALGKPLVIDGSGALTLNGDTGISAGVKDELASIIGQKRIIPVFSSVSGNGNNANYTIVKWVGIRVLDVKLSGKMSGKKVVVQAAPVIAPFGVTSTAGTASSDYVFTPVVLAR